MSNLQTIARRCPVMGKALAVQTAKSSKVGLGGVAAIGAIRAFSGKASSGKAKLHTSQHHEARAVDTMLFSKNGTIIKPEEKKITPLINAQSLLQRTSRLTH